ncbi:unnamed protein product, partial [Effrenium voratum]
VLGDLQEQVVQQVGRCVPLDDGVVRMQLEHGWVTLDARAGGGPLFFHLLLLATDRARWRALAPAWLRKSCEVNSERCGKVSAGQILEQLGPWQRTGEESWCVCPSRGPGRREAWPGSRC